MNLALRPVDISLNNLFFLDKVKNTIIENSYFTRIIYGDTLFTLNGLYIKIYIEDISQIKYYNKIKYTFSIEKNKDLFQYIKQLEKGILEKYAYSNKTPKYNLIDQFRLGWMKITTCNGIHFPTNSKDYILKIAGIWETNQEYGLTFKFMEANHL